MADWSEQDDARLRAMWREGVPMTGIADRLNRSKGAIAGRVWRLELPQRGTPVSFTVKTVGDPAHAVVRLSPLEQALLRALWADGHTMAQIAVRMRRSKGSINGLVHRMALPARPSPIKPAGAPRRPPRPRGGGAVALPALASVDERPAPLALGPVASDPAVVPPPAGDLSLAGLRAARGVPPRSCGWPMWSHHARPTHVYCEAPVTGGRRVLFCAAHARLAHTPGRPADEERAA